MASQSRWCRLHHYRALSYCWGVLDDVREVTVLFENEASTNFHELEGDGARSVAFIITTNLYDALTSLYHSSYGYYSGQIYSVSTSGTLMSGCSMAFMRCIYKPAESVVVRLVRDPEFRDAIFALESYWFVLFNLALEESGVEGTNLPAS